MRAGFGSALFGSALFGSALFGSALVESVLVGSAFCLLATACTAQPPDVEPQPTDLADAGGPTYVDQVISYTQDGLPVTCTESLGPVCQSATGMCANHEVIGAPDGVSFTLGGLAQLEVGFLCQPIVDRAPNSDLSPDFKVWGTIESGLGGVVSVSENGTDYIFVDNFISDNQSFDLSNQGLEYARFVRIVSENGSSLQIDAVEALP